MTIFFVYLSTDPPVEMKENSYLFESEPLFFTTKTDWQPSKFFQTDKEKKLLDNKNSSFFEHLSQFWNLLVARPESLSQKPNSCISEILEEEKGISANEMITKILSEKLGLEQDSAEVLNAVEKSNQIYHEDFPGDFILEYNGTRLGLFLSDVCYDSSNEVTPIYRFKPDLKSFHGIY